jgi:hypothetical protein
VYSIVVTLSSPSKSVTVTSMADITKLGATSAITVMGYNVAALQLVAQDQTTAALIDKDPQAKSSDFTATIYWGDGGVTNNATITQPGGPGKPFYVDAIHTYKNVGLFYVYVMILDKQGNPYVTASMATVYSNGGGHAGVAPGGPGVHGSVQPGDAPLVGADVLFAANGVQQPTGAAFPGGIRLTRAGAGGPALPIQPSGSLPLGASSPADAVSGQTLYLLLHGDRFSNRLGWVADQLALVLNSSMD